MMASKRPKPPLSRQIQSRVMSVVNVPMRVLLGLPFPTPLSRWLMLITFTGRKTGKLYRQPVSYVQQDNMLLTPGGGNWKWNLQAGQPVHIRLRGRDVLARPELIKDTDEVERLFAVMIAANPTVRVMSGIPKGPDGRPDRGHLVDDVGHGFRIVCWHLGEEVHLSPELRNEVVAGSK
jgi:deazaflavin-dependent oxidoreductase (nitroreductase family)